MCVWGEHGRTRPLNTPGGARQECRQPLFSTLQHSAHKHSCPSHGPFVPVVLLEFLSWTLSASMDMYYWQLHYTPGQTLSLACSVKLHPDCVTPAASKSLNKRRKVAEPSYLTIRWCRETCICLQAQGKDRQHIKSADIDLHGLHNTNLQGSFLKAIDQIFKGSVENLWTINISPVVDSFFNNLHYMRW